MLNKEADNLTANIGRLVVKYRWFIIFFNILILVGLFMAMGKRGTEFGDHVSYMKHLRDNPLDKEEAHRSPPPIFNVDYRIFFDEDNPELVAYDEFQKVFAREENLIIAVNSKNGDLFSNENLASLKSIVDEAWTLPYVIRVDGLTNFNYTKVDGDELLVEDFITGMPFDEEQLSHKKKLALQDPLMPKFLISKDASLTQISIRVVVPPDFPDGFLEIEEAASALVSSIKIENSDLDITLGGVVMLNNAFRTYSEKDMQRLLPLMFLLIMVILIITIRSVTAMILPMILLFTSIMVPIFLFVGLFEKSLNSVTMNVVQILVAVAIADSVHVLAVYFKALRHGLDTKEAVIHTVERTFVPCLLTSITTAIGFFSLLLQNMPPFRDLGLFAGTGTLYAFYASMFTMPAFLSLLPFQARGKEKSSQLNVPHPIYVKMVKWVVAHQKSLRFVSMGIAAACLASFLLIDVDSTAVKYFSPRTEFRKATEFIEEKIIGTNPIEFSFESGKADGVHEPEFLKKIERFVEYVDSHPELHITYVSSIVDVVKRLNHTLNGAIKGTYHIPSRDTVTAEGDTLYARKLIAQYLMLYTLSLPQGMELTNQLNLDNSKARVTAFIKSKSSKEQIRVAEHLNEWLKKEMPEVQARALGVPIMFGRLMEVAIPGMLRSLAVSLFFITLSLIITFRSLRVGLYSMIPNLWPLIVIFGVVGMVGYTVNLSVAVVGMVTLGICVDDTIHFLVKYLNARKAGKSREDSLLQAYHLAGTPILFTSIILVAGFGSLSISDFTLNSNMGILCSSVIALAYFADMILLPAVILRWEKD